MFETLKRWRDSYSFQEGVAIGVALAWAHVAVGLWFGLMPEPRATLPVPAPWETMPDLELENDGPETLLVLDPKDGGRMDEFISIRSGETMRWVLDTSLHPNLRVACPPPETRPSAVLSTLKGGSPAACVDACRDVYGTQPTWTACDQAWRRWSAP